VVEIRRLGEADAEACDAVVASLPYHFGDEGGRDACAEAVRTQPGLVATTDGGAVVGFITWTIPEGLAAEITWLAVEAGHRRQGIGGVLVDALISALPTTTRYLVVTTLAEQSEPDPPPDGYQTTRRFYRQHGFEPLWRPAGWWDETNQAELMARDLRGA